MCPLEVPVSVPEEAATQRVLNSARGLLSLPQFFLDKIEPEPMSGCWLWTGSRTANGYGLATRKGRTQAAHRAVYELLVGPITKPTLDHKCRVRCCVNPDHLRPMTLRDNIMAPGSTAPSKLNADKTCCPRHGTPFFTKRRGDKPGIRRDCRECRREYDRAAYRRRHPSERLSAGLR